MSRSVAFLRGIAKVDMLGIGLDPSRFRTVTAASIDDRPFGSLESQIPDVERFKDARPFVVHCGQCNAEFSFKSVADLKVSNGLNRRKRRVKLESDRRQP